MNNYPVNRTDFRLLRGVTNEVIFFVRDIDRKPVSLTMGDTLTINIVANDTLLMARNLTVVDLAKGIYQFATMSAEMDSWPTGPVRWSMTYHRSATNDNVMLWTDLSYSPYSYLYVTDGPLPGPAPTVTTVWAAFTQFPNVIPAPQFNSYYSGPLIGAAQNGYLNGVQTFVYTMNAFTGTVEIDATLVTQPDLSASSPDWSSVDSVNYTAATSDTRNIVGNYIWLRVLVTPMSGSFVQMSYKV
jgi:hypothetical protein